MTVANNYKPIKQVGNGNTTSFSFDFPVITESEVEVYQNTGGIENLVDNNSYTITLNSNGGTINFKTAPAKGVVIAIVRNVDLTQETPFLTSSGFPAGRVEDCFDKLTMITQQQQQVLDRCVKVVVTDNQTPEELLDEVYNKLDSASEISAQAQKAADDAFDALEETNKTLTETKAYATSAKSDINNARNEAVTAANNATQSVISTSNQAITTITSVRDDAVNIVEKEVATAINEITDKAIDAAENVVADVVGQYTERAETAAVSAEADANSAATSAASASANAIKAEANADEVAIYNFKNKITNCITEIPQDIKLELNNGTLTLKAGSKVYVPNGAGKFDEVTIQNDIVNNISSTTAQTAFLFYNTNSGAFNSWYAPNIYSGSGAPSSSQTGTLWYDSTNNQYYWKSGSSWVALDDYSLPLGFGTWDGSKWTSIDQVFNGFGYIGSTVFILPGVKGLISDGWNADGTYNNMVSQLKSVYTSTFTDTNSTRTLCLMFGNTGGYASGGMEEVDILPTNPVGMRRYYLKSKNEWFWWQNGVWTVDHLVKVADIVTESGIIKSLKPQLPFRAVDQNDFNKGVNTLDDKVNTLDAQNVKLTGNQTINGIKTFTSSQYVKSRDIDMSITPSTTKWNVITWGQDKNDVVLGVEHFAHNANGTLEHLIDVRRIINGASTSSYIIVGMDANGGKYAKISQTPAINDNSNQIATTYWVRKKAFPNYASGVAISSGITAPSDGLIVLFEKSQSGFLHGSFTVNSVKVCEWSTLDGGRSNLTFVVQKGDLIEFTNATATLFPLS